MYTSFAVSTGTGACNLQGTVVLTGAGLHVFVGGGDRPHIGTVVLCQPRPSLTGDGRRSCTTSVVNLLGHKDDRLAVPLAEGLCRELNLVTGVTAGIHIENATGEEIQTLLEQGQELMRQIMARVEAPFPEAPARRTEREAAPAPVPRPWALIREQVQAEIRAGLKAELQTELQTQLAGSFRDSLQEWIQEEVARQVAEQIPKAPPLPPEPEKSNRPALVTPQEAAFLQMLTFGTPHNR